MKQIFEKTNDWGHYLKVGHSFGLKLSLMMSRDVVSHLKGSDLKQSQNQIKIDMKSQIKWQSMPTNTWEFLHQTRT